MNTIQHGAGCNVIQMPQLNQNLLSQIFGDVEVFCAKDMNATFWTARLGDLSLIRATHSSYNCRSRHLKRHTENRGSNFHYLCLPVSGEIGIEHVGRSCAVTPGTMCLVSTDYEYFIEMSDDLDAFWLRIPSTSMQGGGDHRHRLLCHNFDASAGIGKITADLLNSSLSTAHYLDHHGGHLVAQSLLFFLSDILAAQTPVLLERRSTPHQRKIFDRARQFIENNISDENLQPDLVAEKIGVSKRYLSQIFAGEGTSVMRWIQNRRLEICNEQIKRGGAEMFSIQELAYSAGFSNVSSFNRSFKLKYGLSPSQIKRN